MFAAAFVQSVRTITELRRVNLSSTEGELTSFSEVPHMLQHLHSMHCQRYVFTAAIITGVNCRQEGWPANKQKTETHLRGHEMNTNLFLSVKE